MYGLYIKEREHGLPFRTPRWTQQEDEAVDRSTQCFVWVGSDPHCLAVPVDRGYPVQAG
jgi:hypothetical protein